MACAALATASAAKRRQLLWTKLFIFPVEGVEIFKGDDIRILEVEQVVSRNRHHKTNERDHDSPLHRMEFLDFFELLYFAPTTVQNQFIQKKGLILNKCGQ